MCVTGAPDEPDIYKESRTPGLSIALGTQGNAAPTRSKAGESAAEVALLGDSHLAGCPFHLHPFSSRAEPRATVSIFQGKQ